MSEDLTQNLPQPGLDLILVRLDSIDHNFGLMDSRLTNLEERVDRRLSETRPIWEQVLLSHERLEKRVGSVESALEANTAKLNGVEGKLNGVEGKLNEVEGRLNGVEGKLNGVEGKLNGVESKLNGVESKLNGVEGKLNGVEDKLQALDNKVENLGLDMRAGFKRLERQIGEIARDSIELHADQSDLEKRMDRLEGN